MSALRPRGTRRAQSGTRKGGVLGRGPLCREVTSWQHPPALNLLLGLPLAKGSQEAEDMTP